MKRLLLRTLGLTAIVLLSNLPTVKAAEGDCHVSCCNGDSYDGPLPPGYYSCCDVFRDLCRYKGEAYVETSWAPEGIAYCLNEGTCWD
jgi:hypothetical protein